MHRAHPDSIHPLWLRCCHWVNVVAVAGMLFSGWRIYNASPLFPFTFPAQFTLGGWLGGALQWHFAMMWVLILNGVIYIVLGVFTGRFLNKLFPLSFQQFKYEFIQSLHGKLMHADLRQYNMIQKFAYLTLLLDGVGLVISGMVLWKPFQFPVLSMILGGYESARYIHFFSMSAMALFIIIHLLMVLLVPRTLLVMLRGR